jgi:hypothetical protein
MPNAPGRFQGPFLFSRGSCSSTHSTCFPAPHSLGAWRGYHESIHARLPFVHSCTADAALQEDMGRADERQERAARNLVQPLTFGAPRG